MKIARLTCVGTREERHIIINDYLDCGFDRLVDHCMNLGVHRTPHVLLIATLYEAVRSSFSMGNVDLRQCYIWLRTAVTMPLTDGDSVERFLLERTGNFRNPITSAAEVGPMARLL